MAEEKTLTAKEELFCQYYAREANGAKAARQAGYSVDSAKEIAHSNLTKVHIQKRVTELRKDITGQLNAGKERMIEELCKIAYGTLVPLYDEKGNLKPVADWDEDTAAMVSSIETEETFEGSGADRVFSGYVKKVKSWDKLKAHDQLAKLLGYYTPEKTAFTDPDGNALLPSINVFTSTPAPDKLGDLETKD